MAALGSTFFPSGEGRGGGESFVEDACCNNSFM